MPSDASLPPNPLMTNGIIPRPDHGEADASTTTMTTTSSSSSTPPPLSAVCADLHRRLSAFLSSPPKDETTRRTQAQTRISLEVIERALQEYGFSHLSLSYNGGKDCLVLLILYLAVLHTHFQSSSASSSSFPSSIPSIYAKPPDPFPSVTRFVESSSLAYHLSLVHISTNPGPIPGHSQSNVHALPPGTSPRVTFRDAFAQYLAAHREVRAIFVGTRRTDPHGATLTHADRTDKGWPDFMRLHPVIDWRLSEIWCFLRAPELSGSLPHDDDNDNGTSVQGQGQGQSKITGESIGLSSSSFPPSSSSSEASSHLPYCDMYDEGYTSLGGVGDTLRNPKLRYWNPDLAKHCYKPAYLLTEDDEERLGRE